MSTQQTFTITLSFYSTTLKHLVALMSANDLLHISLRSVSHRGAFVLFVGLAVDEGWEVFVDEGDVDVLELGASEGLAEGLAVGR